MERDVALEKNSLRHEKISVGVVFYREHQKLIELLNFFTKPALKGFISEILLIANSAEPDSIRAVQEHISNFESQELFEALPKIILRIQVDSNLALARQSILETSIENWVYFTDPDCLPSESTIPFLFAHRAEPLFAVAGPNLVPKINDPFYCGLELLFKTWLGNFGSTQSTFWSEPRLVNHAPTCNILYNKRNLIFKFDSNFQKTGEDLDFNWSHSKYQPKSILFLPQASVDHFHPTNFLGWFNKVYKWGFAQPQVFIKHPSAALLYKISPILVSILALLLVATHPILFFLMLALYLFATIANSLFVILTWSKYNYFLLHLLLTWTTHIAYLSGQWLSAIYLVPKIFAKFFAAKSKWIET